MRNSTRDFPQLIVLMVDQSGSMSDRCGAKTKAQAVADDLNRLIYNMVLKATKGEEVWNYFFVSIITYGSGVGAGLTAAEPGQYGNDILPISVVANNQRRIEQRQVDNGVGELTTFNLPIWLEAQANGGTPMTAAFTKAKSICETWLSNPNHQECNPPIVINLTDGEWTDGSPSDIVRQIQTLSTNYGKAMVFNLHFAPGNTPIGFPDSAEELTNDYARQLFAISSPLDPDMIEFGRKRYGWPLKDNSRGYVWNGDNTFVIMALDIGTRVVVDSGQR